MVLGMQSFGAVFYALGLGHLGFTTCVILGVAVMSVRQVWTIRMGMRGIVISDVFQGIVAYIVGSALMIGLIAWLIVSQDASIAAIAPEKLSLPTLDSNEPLLFLSLTLLPLLCSLCWPDLFIRLYTGSGVEAVKRSSAYCAPLSLVFVTALGFLALLSSSRADVLASPETAWFTLNLAAGGVPLLALAGTIVFAASMGNIDATVQSMGAQIANDVVGAVRPLGERGLMLVSQISIAAITLVSAIIACLPLPSLFSIGLFAFQVMVQIAVPLYLGIFTKIGDAGGALAGMIAGIAMVVILQVLYPVGIPWAYGLTSGFVGLIVNLAIYLGAAALVPRGAKEQARLDDLFADADGTSAQVSVGPLVGATAAGRVQAGQ